MNIAATRDSVRATFLLEVALDEARTRQRVADFLLQERSRRGHGDARRFPQPKMADLLGVSLRTYQHWEAADTMPTWRNLEEVAGRLKVDVTDIIGEVSPEVAAAGETEILDRLDEIVQRLERLEKAAGVRKPPRARRAAGSSRRGSG